MSAATAAAETTAATFVAGGRDWVSLVGNRAGKAGQVANSASSHTGRAVNHRSGKIRTGNIGQGERRFAAAA